MEQYIMKGGNPLAGEVMISGAKNAALGILAAAIMTDEDVLIENLPDVRSPWSCLSPAPYRSGGLPDSLRPRLCL